MKRLSVSLAISLAAVLAAPLVASAQQAIQEDATLEDEARALFEAGRTAYESARYDAALNYFTQAHQIVPRPALLFNMAASADRLQRTEQALQWYRQYITEMPQAPNRATVERRITFLEGILAEQRAQQAASPQVTQTADPTTDQAPAGGGDVTSEWWFWTIIAVVVVGAGVGIGVGVAMSSSSQIEEPIPGDFPATAALRVSF